MGRGDVFEQAVAGVVEELAFLFFLDGFDGEAELLLDLIERVAEEVGDFGLDVDDGGDGIEDKLAGLLVIVDERIGDGLFVFLIADDFDGIFIDDAIDAEGAGFEGLPVEKANEPARGNGAVLGRGFGDVGELECGAFAESVLGGFGHWVS